MNKEIFRPLGLSLKIQVRNADTVVSVPVLSLAPGMMIFPYEKGEDIVAVSGMVIHGREVHFHYPSEYIEGDRCAVYWDNWSLSLTIYNLWLAGLSLDQKEAMITEVLEWDEALETEFFEEDRLEKVDAQMGEVEEELDNVEVLADWRGRADHKIKKAS